MKWLRYLIFGLVLCACPAYAITVMVISGSAAAGPDYSDITFWWTAENTTMGTGDCSAGDTTAATGSAAVINTDAVKMGTNGADFPGALDIFSFAVTAEDIINDAEGCVAWWMRVNTWVDTTFVFAFGDQSDYYADSLDARIIGTDEVRIRWNSAAGADADISSTAANVDGNWHFYELCWDVDANPSNTFWMEIDNSIVASTTDNLGSFTDIDDARWGTLTNDAADIHMDNMLISNSKARDFYLLKDVDDYPGSEGGCVAQ